jgi:hypothetical protein
MFLTGLFESHQRHDQALRHISPFSIPQLSGSLRHSSFIATACGCASDAALLFLLAASLVGS